jgi:hypothetical protein
MHVVHQFKSSYTYTACCRCGPHSETHSALPASAALQLPVSLARRAMHWADLACWTAAVNSLAHARMTHATPPCAHGPPVVHSPRAQMRAPDAAACSLTPGHPSRAPSAPLPSPGHHLLPLAILLLPPRDSHPPHHKALHLSPHVIALPIRCCPALAACSARLV